MRFTIKINSTTHILFFRDDLEWKLRHLILSHHGREEYSSPIEPKTLEAEILHLIVSLDAKYKE